MLESAAAIVGAGKPFELMEATPGGIPCRVFRRGPGTLPDLYKRVAALGNRELVVCGGHRLTTREVLARAYIVSRHLVDEAGVRAGARVAVIAGNHPQWVISFVAITSIGATAVAIHNRTGLTEMVSALEDAEVDVVIADDTVARMLIERDGRRRILPILEVDSIPRVTPAEAGWESLDSAQLVRARQEISIDPQFPALIAFTSGTTGRPKGVISTHLSMMTGMMNMLLGGALAAARDTARKPASRNTPPVSLVLAPLSYVGGYFNLLLMWYLGGRVVMLPDATGDVAVAKIQQEAVTGLVGATPTLVAEVLESARRRNDGASSLRSINVHGGHLTPALRADIAEVLPQVILGTGYGMTETNGSICSASGSTLTSKPDTCGRPLPSVDLRIAREDGSDAPRGEAGEIFVRGAMVMQGYCGWPEATKSVLRDGWLRTGDLGILDTDDDLEIVDRVNNVLLCDGVRISHSQIERIVIDQCSARQAVTLGVEAVGGSHRVVIVAVPQEGHSLDSNRITECLLQAGVGGTAAPRIVGVDSLPHTPSGKVDSRELRRRILPLSG